MAEVNSRRESQPSERVFGLAETKGGAQPAAENGAVPGLQRADPR